MPTINSCDYSPVQYNTITGGANGQINNVSPGTSGQVLTSNGSSSQPTFQTPFLGIPTNIQVFTSSGTYTPTAGMANCYVEVVGGGGGSGGTAATAAGQGASAGGGGGGGYAAGFFSAATIGTSQVVTIGAGGLAATAGNNTGGTGGTTSLGALISATGGAGGQGGPSNPGGGSSPGGAGGAGSGGSFQTVGEGGGSSLNYTLVINVAGFGGSCFYGGGAPNAQVTGGLPGQSYGGGASGPASGQSTAAKAGQAGAGGVIIITEYVV
jgi:hypothetical protein